MSLAEELYRQSTSDLQVYETPSVLVDVVFIILMSIIHISYASKFTTFSFGYLKAKLEEKKSRSKWSESKLYSHAVCFTNPRLNMQHNDECDDQIYTKLWIQLSFIRNIFKVLIFVCCCCIFVLYLSFLLNIFYEYIVVCIVYYADASFLALIILPFFWFINVCFMRFFVFAMMASWSVNVDCIADTIAYQQHHCASKQYAHEGDQNNNNNDTDAFTMTTDVSERTIQREATLRDHLKGFFSDYFMAVHWRLWIICCSAIATVFALPTSSTASSSQNIHEIESKFTDIFWCQLFLRYVLIAMFIWMVLYFCLAIGSGIYGLVATLSVFNEVMDEQLHEDETPSIKHTLLRVFCLTDAFMIKDRDIWWRNYKFVIYFLFCASGVLCIIIGSAVQNGLVRFVGIINTLFYLTQILLICKIRGIHYLWRSDMVSLELKNWWNQPMIDCHEKDTKKYQSTDSHAAQMIGLKHTQLRNLLPVRNVVYSEIDRTDDDDMDQKQESEVDEQQSVILSVHDGNDEEDETLEVRSEEDVLSLYTATHTKLYNERNRLYQKRKALVWYKTIAINVALLCNYFGIIFKLYKLYWFLILPYHYEIRPLSIIASGKSVSERFARYRHSSSSPKETVHKISNCICHGMRGMLCLGAFIAALCGLIYLTLQLHDNYIVTSEYTQSNTSHSGPYTTENHYPICQTKWNANLSVFDLASLAHMAYEVEEDAELQLMSMQHLMCLYFDRIPPHEIGNTTDVCSWQIVYISRSSPAFIHIRHAKSDTEVIFIRGTWTQEEMSQDIALFNEVALLQAASWVIPITTILPQHFITRIVYFVSLFEGSINMEIRARFDEPLFEYSYKYLQNINHSVNALYFIGHSLGGGISQIVAAQLYRAYTANHIKNDDLNNLEIKSFSLAAPGLVWGSRKFSIDVQDLYETATLLKPRHDIVSSVDKYGGLTQNLECQEQLVLQCHLTANTICQLSNECNVYDSHNPKLIQSFCKYHDDPQIGDLYMGYANYSS